MRFRPLVLVIVATLAQALTCSASHAGFEGKKEDLSIVATKFRENLDRLKTWQGKVKLTHRVEDTEAGSGVLVECAIEFAYDAQSKSYRYNITPLRDVSFDKHGEKPRRLLRWTSGLFNKDGHYEFESSKAETSSSIQTAFLNRKASHKSAWHYMSFEPMFFYTDKGIAHDRHLQILIDNFAHEAAHGWVKRDGESITVRQTIDDDSVERAFSLDKGGNAVRVTTLEKRDNGSERVTEYSWDWQQVNGVWVPKRASKNDKGQQARYKDKKIDNLKVTFEWVQNRVNEPLDKGALSLPSLGLRQGDRIVNKITGKTIIVDGPEFPSRKPVPTGRVATSSH